MAGAFDPDGRVDATRLAGALDPEPARILESGPMRLAYSGSALEASTPLCLLDGFLDNASELELELGAEHAGSHEELLAAGYRRWGRGLLPRLRGDFILLLWDRARGEGLLARDQLGVRPLFLSGAGRALRFAGEVRHLLGLSSRRPPPDRASVAHWIAVSSRPGTHTLYEGIRRLGPGGVVVFDRDGFREDSYWAPTFEAPLELPHDRLAERLRDGLATAVRRRVAPIGSTGVLLSGGLDSSAVAALCASEAGDEVQACSATFPGRPEADESKLIGGLRHELALGGVTVEVRPGGLVASALEHLEAWQMPLLGWGDFWTLPLLRIAATAGVETMLDGDGGDELFGPRAYLLADRLRAGHPLEARALSLELPGGGAHVPRRDVAAVLRSFALAGALPLRLHDALSKPLARRGLPSWLRRRPASELVESDDPHAWKRLDGPRWWAHAAHGVTRGIEEAGVFEHQRRRAELAGLQARHPFLDLDLVELALRQPPRATLDRRFNRPLLRASMAGLLPDEVRLRPAKARFESLIADTLNGPDRAAVRHILEGPDLALGAYLDPVAMRRALFEPDSPARIGAFRWMWQVWRLLTAELWLRAQESAIPDLLPNSLPSKAQITVVRTAGDSYLFPS